MIKEIPKYTKDTYRVKPLPDVDEDKFVYKVPNTERLRPIQSSQKEVLPDPLPFDTQ